MRSVHLHRLAWDGGSSFMYFGTINAAHTYAKQTLHLKRAKYEIEDVECRVTADAIALALNIALERRKM